MSGKLKTKLKINSKKLSKEDYKFLWLFEYFSEIGNQLTYVLFFTAAIFALLLYGIYAQIASEDIAGIHSFIWALIVLGFF